MKIPISVLDLATVGEGMSIRDAFDASVQLAQATERWGYNRYWIAEHHNIDGVASSATPVLIGHVAGQTSKIRVGSGGIMLPNHSPLIVAEQFGTLETLYPGRIDLGLGRAPGTDPRTMKAIRRDNAVRGDDFAELLEELEYYFKTPEELQRVRAIPGAGLDIPIWILGSSLYSAQLAGTQGRPYAFAGHFAPQLMYEALHVYRNFFRPSRHLDKPYVMIGVPIVAAETNEKARSLATTVQQVFLSLIRGKRLRAQQPVASMEGLWTPQEEAAVASMLSTLVVGDVHAVSAGIHQLVESTGADELIITSHVYRTADRLRSYELIAESQSVSIPNK